MKALNKICQVLAIVFGLASLVLFFTDFATIVTDGVAEKLVGTELAFGSKITTTAGDTYNMAKSSQILFCFILTAVAAVMSIFSFKKKGLRYAAPAFGIVAAVYMLVKTLSAALKFVDPRPLPNVTAVTLTSSVLFATIALFLFVIFAVAYLLIDDYLEVKASNGEKMVIFKRIGLFFRDYKSEVKKIVWPGFKEVIKNTVIVLIMCVIIGALIWVIDFGLGQLLDVILGINAGGQ